MALQHDKQSDDQMPHKPKGSKDPNNRALGPRYYNMNDIWALQPYRLGPWTCRESPLNLKSETPTLGLKKLSPKPPRPKPETPDPKPKIPNRKPYNPTPTTSESKDFSATRGALVEEILSSRVEKSFFMFRLFQGLAFRSLGFRSLGV